MKLNAPKKNLFWVTVVLAVLALIGTFVSVPLLSAWAFWLLLVAYVVLVIGNVMKGL